MLSDYFLGISSHKYVTKMYICSTGKKIFSLNIDDELLDIIEDGIDIPIDEEGVAIDRKKHTIIHKKLYKKPHKVRGVIVAALSHSEYLKLGDK
jgi:hypothetical protein